MSDAARQAHAEALFVRGLLDECPRCGYAPPPSATDWESLCEHLRGCTDARAHAAHQRNEAAAAAAAERKATRQDADAEAQNLAAWQFLGGSTESMWLLTDTQLRKQCEEAGLGGDASRDGMLAALSRHRTALQAERLTDRSGGAPAQLKHSGEAGDEAPPASKRRRQADGGASASSSSSARGRVSAASLPSNLHSMSLRQLKSVCAAHGLVPAGETTDEVIAELERALYGGTEAAPLLLE
eukprot:7381766-Prymnesium_polylepis.1